MPIHKKSSFLVPTPLRSNPDKKHLFMAITDPDANNCVMCVNATECTIEELYDDEIDKSCILIPGCHDFITKLSRVYYEDARLLDMNVIKNEIRNGNYVEKSDISDNILKKVQKGAEKSDALPKRFREYFELF
jgi:hypothetical protein